jgi:quinol monooxygenase YgiN/mannose-6-phosphate isomerase-like protein (cupin superfamily)
MTQVSRHATAVARPGKGDELAALLLAAAAELERDPGCELYLVNRRRDAPDTITVTELWRSQADLDASVEKIKHSPEVAQVRELAERWEIAELELLGGKGAATQAEPVEPYTIRKLTDLDDAAVKFGFADRGSARFASEELAAQRTGVSHHHLKPGRRQAFGHRHSDAEEVYVVLSGSGRVKLDEEIADIAERDALRVAPPVIRAFEAGPDGLELVAFGPRCRGDGEVLQNWWSD